MMTRDPEIIETCAKYYRGYFYQIDIWGYNFPGTQPIPAQSDVMIDGKRMSLKQDSLWAECHKKYKMKRMDQCILCVMEYIDKKFFNT